MRKTGNTENVKYDKAVIETPTSFDEYPKKGAAKMLHSLGATNTQETPSGIISIFNDGEITMDETVTCHLDIIDREGTIPLYLGRLEKVNGFLKDFSLLHSNAVDVSIYNNSGKPLGDLVPPALDSFSRLDWNSMRIKLTTKKQRNLTGIDKEIFKYSSSLGLVPVYLIRENKKILYAVNRENKETAYSLTVKLKKKNEEMQQ